MSRYESWGRYPQVKSRTVMRPVDMPTLTAAVQHGARVLPYGWGRSYGDSCLTDGVLIDMRSFDHLLSFDNDTGVLRCEGGVTIRDIVQYLLPRGWFLPVTPGTQFVTVAGAVANDVHGKNHPSAGTWGRHVRRFELLRSSGERLVCSPTEHADLFAATIGGLGLTGIIIWVELQLVRWPSPYFTVELTEFNSLEEYLELVQQASQTWPYLVAWFDSFSSTGRGILSQARVADEELIEVMSSGRQLHVPIEAPSWLLNAPLMRAYNAGRWWWQRRQSEAQRVALEQFIYELDRISDWNLLYGSAGFLQYQFVVPWRTAEQTVRGIWDAILTSPERSYLVTSRIFGELASPGLLSFPRPGVTFALDFPNHGESTLQLLNQLDDIVIQAGGALYPAKDSRMSPELFRASFPHWQDFVQYKDPKFSSSFWERVTQQL